MLLQLKDHLQIKLGVKAGDVILKVDDTPITEVNVEKTIALIKGEEGKEVKLTVQRDGGEPIDISIVRGVSQHGCC